MRLDPVSEAVKSRACCDNDGVFKLYEVFLHVALLSIGTVQHSQQSHGVVHQQHVLHNDAASKVEHDTIVIVLIGQKTHYSSAALKSIFLVQVNTMEAGMGHIPTAIFSIQ